MRRRGATFATDLTGTAGESERLLGPALGSRDDHEEGAAGDDSGNDSTKEQRKVLLRAASHRSVTTTAEVVHHLHRQRSSSAIPHVFPKHDPTKGTNLSSDHVDGGTPRVRRHSTKSDGGESEGKEGGDGEEDPTAYRINYEEHLMPLNELADLYQTEIDLQNPKDSGGLKPVQAAELLKKFGANALTPPPRTPGWLLFAMQFTNLFMILLIVAALLSIIIYVLYGEPSDLYLGVILFIVVLATCYETYAQEVKSEDFLESLKTLVPEMTIATRGGEQVSVKVEDLVIGDVIKLRFGDKVPADCRVIYTQGLKVDQTSITGESEATGEVECTVECTHTDPLKARNIIFSGSLVVDGSAQAVVIRTGDDTLVGGVVGLTSDVGKGESNLKKDIELFVFIILIFALVQAVGVLIASVLLGDSFVDAFVNGFIVIIIANVPQGLPSTIVACLVIVAERMAEVKIFVKKLDVIEALGACTMVCTDKTGILTLNEMRVENVWVMNERFSSEEFAQQNKRAVKADKLDANEQIKTLLEIAVLNSRVILDRKEANGPLVPMGDSVELGLYRFLREIVADRTGMDIEEYRSENPKVFDIPLTSSAKWQMSTHQMADIEHNTARGRQIMILKGTPDILINKCSEYMAADGTTRPIDKDFVLKYAELCDALRGQGEMIQSYAMRTLERTVEQEEAADKRWKDKMKARLAGKGSGGGGHEEPLRDFVFVGLITIMDPPREEVGQSISDLQTAGVKVVMVTGDHPLTAEAIGRKIGLITLPSIVLQDDEDVLDKIDKMKTLIDKERMDLEGQQQSKSEERSSDNASDKISERAEMAYAVIVLGTRIDHLTAEEWAAITGTREIVFARTSPEQKLTIVEEFTKAGHVIAMTGDGVHDLPALRQASIAIAMGLEGSDVAREAADIILLDDNFASIVVSIKEGRLLFANLKKSIAYTLAHSMPEVLPVLLYTVVGWPQPINSILLLLIDLLTELVPAISLAYEKAEANIMHVPPRNVATDKLVSFPLLSYAYLQAGMVITGCCLYVYFQSFAHYCITAEDINNNHGVYFKEKGTAPDFTTSCGAVYDDEEQDQILGVVQAGYYLMIVCAQAVHVFVCRTAVISIFEHGIFNNMTTNLGVCIAILLGCMVVYIPVLQTIDGAGDAIPETIAVGTTMAFVILWGGTETRKWFSRTYPKHWFNSYVQCDMRLGANFQTVACDFEKVFRVSDKLYIGLTGLATDVLTLEALLKFRCNMYKLRENREMKPETFSALVSTLLYEKRFGPYFTEPVVAGLLEDGTPFLSGMDLIGAPVFTKDFVVSGTCTSNLHGMCESLFRPDMDADQLFEVLSQCLLNAVDRDALSGWGAVVHIITPDGVHTRKLRCRQD